MNEIEIRRLFISDDEWDRTSPSWKELKPLRDFNTFKASDETTDECFRRLRAAHYNIPYLVITQWLYPHYYNQNTITNYGWIDFKNVLFIESSLSINELTNIYIVNSYRDYVRRRAKSKPFEDFTCAPEDLRHWKTYSTWRIPPLILDVASFSNIPSYTEVQGPFQLVEGHTRLGYLYALEASGVLQTREHKVFLLRNLSI